MEGNTQKDKTGSIRSQMEAKSNEELLGIWQENDRREWRPEAFEAISQVLQARGIVLPSQASSLANFEKPTPKWRGASIVVIITIIILFLCLLGIGSGVLLFGSKIR